MIFIGEQEQYQRRRSIETAVASMQAAGRQVQLVVYPGVGRGFDFRPPHVRTLADDLASQDAVQRAARFMRRTLKTYAK
jgi:carboxymethylenebutenolidase